MEKLKVLIVEDEMIPALSWRSILERHDYFVTDIVTNGDDCLASFGNKEPDVVLMDIKLKGRLDGIATAEKIREQSPVPIIFITRIKDRGLFLKAKKTIPQNYITKPVIESTLLNAVELAIQNSPKRPIVRVGDAVFILIKDNVRVKLLLDDILYLEACGPGPYTKIHFESKEKKTDSYYTVTTSSNHVLEQMEFSALIRVHRSYCVNIEKIDKLHNSSVTIKGTEIEVSESYFRELKKKLPCIKSTHGSR